MPATLLLLQTKEDERLTEKGLYIKDLRVWHFNISYPFNWSVNFNYKDSVWSKNN